MDSAKDDQERDKLRGSRAPLRLSFVTGKRSARF